ncbi:MAG: cytidine deaminase [Planctomycetota bacterium]|jgi:cytidine deaminase
MSTSDETLLAEATRAMDRAWSPYSGFSVGAALLSAGGRIFTGCNVENASYGLTMCAERAAVFKAVSEGEREFRRLVLVCDGERPVSPCGACLQVLREFNRDLPMLLANAMGEKRETTLSALLPTPFTPEDLGGGAGRGLRESEGPS